LWNAGLISNRRETFEQNKSVQECAFQIREILDALEKRGNSSIGLAIFRELRGLFGQTVIELARPLPPQKCHDLLAMMHPMPALLSQDSDTAHVDPPGDDDGSGDDGRPERWVTAATFWTPPAAQLARIKLESEDIDCQLANENIIAADFLLAAAVGGIKILVPAQQVERARALLTAVPPSMMTVQAAEFGACPECGSANIDRPIFQAKTFWAGIVALMLLGSLVLAPLALAAFAYYVIMWRPWRCRDCGDVFRRGEDRQGFPLG
jgi:hypothetical protein